MAKKKEKQQEHYLKVPNHILNIRGLGKGEKMLLAHIYSYGRKGCWEKNDTLGQMFFRSPRTISGWVSNLKKGGHILWLHPKGFYRTFWAKSHPDVKQAATLLYRNREIPKSEVVSGQAKSTLLRKNLPSEYAENCEVTAQKPVVPLRKKLLQTNNTTNKETTGGTTATPTPLPAAGQAPALLEDRKAGAITAVEQLKRNFGSGKQRSKPLSNAERQQRVQQQRKALLGDKKI